MQGFHAILGKSHARSASGAERGDALAGAAAVGELDRVDVELDHLGCRGAADGGDVQHLAILDQARANEAEQFVGAHRLKGRFDLGCRNPSRVSHTFTHNSI